MILSAQDPSQVLARTAIPLLQPATDAETEGIVPNVVFPTATEMIDNAATIDHTTRSDRDDISRWSKLARERNIEISE